MTTQFSQARQRLGLLLRQQRYDEAVKMLDHYADAGDLDAIYERALWQLFGQTLPRNPENALAAIRKAAAQGHTDAMDAEIALLANGFAGQADQATARLLVRTHASALPKYARQSELLQAMDASAFSDGELLCSEPSIRVIRDFIPHAICEYLIARALPIVRPSFVIDPQTRKRISHPVRISSSANFGPIEEDIVINAVNRRIADLLLSDPRAGEPLHLLRYQEHQEYKLHHDALPGRLNQRSHTAILYLNDDFVGGETEFPALGVTVKPRKASLLVFPNLDNAGRIDHRLVHAGLPVAQGEKWIATRWLRSHPLDLLNDQ